MSFGRKISTAGTVLATLAVAAAQNCTCPDTNSNNSGNNHLAALILLPTIFGTGFIGIGLSIYWRYQEMKKTQETHRKELETQLASNEARLAELKKLHPGLFPSATATQTTAQKTDAPDVDLEAGISIQPKR